MKDHYVLTIDCGTQSLRAMIFSSNGTLEAIKKIEYVPYRETAPGRAEQDAEVYWDSLIKALLCLQEDSPELYGRIEGIGVTTQRDSMVCLDSEGKPLRDAIIWLDQRKAHRIYEPGILMSQVYSFVGMSDTINKLQREGKSNWIKEFEPDIWEKTDSYVQLSGFLNRRITGRSGDSTASQIGHIPFNYKKQRWATKGDITAKLYPIDRKKLVELYAPSEKMGSVCKRFSEITGIPEGLPVIACGSDKGCETIGMGVVDSDRGSLSFGTTATIQTTMDRYVEPLRFIPAYPASIKGKYNPEIEIFRGFWMISWFKEQFGFKEVQESLKTGRSPEEILNTMLDTVPAGSMGLLTQPYWSPALKNPTAKGSIIGFGSVHTKAHLYRSMIEGLCFALLGGMHKIEKVTHRPMKVLTVSGGASRSSGICQIAADIFGLPILRGETSETSGLGAAAIVETGIGTYKTVEDAVTHMVKYADTFKPDQKNHEIYKKLFAVYEKIFPSLRVLYQQIGEITHYPEI